MKFWTHPDYHNNNLIKQLESLDDIQLEVICGKFKIKYYGFDNREYFGVLGWKQSMCKNKHVEFYENNTLLFTKEITRPREFHFVMYGDGITKENTFYLWIETVNCSQSIKVNDFNDDHVKDAQLGPDQYVGTISLNDKYFVTITEEMCTYSRFFGLVNKEQFFIGKNQESWNGLLNIPTVADMSIEEQLKNAKEFLSKLNLPRPYNNARIGLSVDLHYDCDCCMEPIEATQDGLIFADVKYESRKKFYTQTQFVLYGDVENYDQSIENNEI